MDWMGGFERGSPNENLGDLRPDHTPRAAHPEQHGEGADSDSSDSSQLRHAVRVLDERTRINAEQASSHSAPP
eukprot:15433804-Alexandrium_andersonii.AAC.1